MYRYPLRAHTLVHMSAWIKHTNRRPINENYAHTHARAQPQRCNRLSARGPHTATLRGSAKSSLNDREARRFDSRSCDNRARIIHRKQRAREKERERIIPLPFRLKKKKKKKGKMGEEQERAKTRTRAKLLYSSSRDAPMTHHAGIRVPRVLA